MALEAFKAGAYDLRVENIAKNWATGYNFPALEKGLVKKEIFAHGHALGDAGGVGHLSEGMD